MGLIFVKEGWRHLVELHFSIADVVKELVRGRQSFSERYMIKAFCCSNEIIGKIRGVAEVHVHQPPVLLAEEDLVK